MALSPEARSLRAALGPESPAVKLALDRLASIYSETESMAPVDNCYRYWVASCPFDADTTPDIFLRHTCLSLLCRLLAYRYLEARPSERDLWGVVSGDYFVGAGLGNFLGEDFFSWPFFRLSMGIGDNALSMETAKGLLSALESQHLEQPSIEVLSDLYGGFLGNERPVASDLDFSELEENPSLNCIAPYCRDGVSLAQAVHVVLDARLADGQIPPDALLDISGQFVGMTSDPLAATVASLAFLLALGEEVMEPHPPIYIPVYLAHGAHLPPQRLDTNGTDTFVIEPAGGTALPERVAADPLYLDWLLGRLPNYLRGAALRLRAQPENVAVQEVLNAWYNYLTSPKVRTPIPEPLSPNDADVMVEAARTLILMYVKGSGPGPLHIVRNAPAPLFASKRGFDFMLWPRELDADFDLQATCSALYLGENGRVLSA